MQSKRIVATACSMAVGALVLLCAHADAQWLRHPAKGIPRTADGRPDLSAAAPRAIDAKPDLSGRWQKRVHLVDFKTEDRLPWAEAVVRERRESLWKDSPGVMCLPRGPAAITDTVPVKLVHTPNLLMMFWEDLTYRQIFLDGRQLPRDPNPSWMGYSVGRWQGDTLVVESTGFTERSWLFDSNPHSEDLRITERYRRVDLGHMELHVTVDDPKTFVRSWTMTLSMELDPDTEHLEYVCNENEKSRTHMVGRLSDAKAGEVTVDADLLSKYVGIYEMRRPDGSPVRFEISQEGATLFLRRDGRARVQLTPLSATRFMGPAEFEFFTDPNGVATHFTIRSVEGENTAIRKQALRTGDGHPDVEGVWSFATLTPLERPADVMGRPFFTDAEAVAFERATRARVNSDRRDAAGALDLRGPALNEFWFERGPLVSIGGRKPTSLIVDPADGRLPSPTPAAAARRARQAGSRTARSDYRDFSLSERCLRSASGPPYLPGAPDSNLIHITQSRDHIAIVQEKYHETRVISLDRRPHVSQAVRAWMGDSRGHWDGDTLVVHTTQFIEALDDSNRFDRNLRLVERFTRVDPDVLLYEVTVDDPTAFTRPWTVALPMRRTGEQLYEFACHEGNYALPNMLRGARAQERAIER